MRKYAQAVRFLKDDMIIGEGEHGDAVASQQDESGQENTLGMLGPDDCFAQMALLGDPERVASVRVKTVVTSPHLRRAEV